MVLAAQMEARSAEAGLRPPVTDSFAAKHKTAKTLDLFPEERLKFVPRKRDAARWPKLAPDAAVANEAEQDGHGQTSTQRRADDHQMMPRSSKRPVLRSLRVTSALKPPVMFGPPGRQTPPNLYQDSLSPVADVASTPVPRVAPTSPSRLETPGGVSIFATPATPAPPRPVSPASLADSDPHVVANFSPRTDEDAHMQPSTVSSPSMPAEPIISPAPPRPASPAPLAELDPHVVAQLSPQTNDGHDMSAASVSSSPLASTPTPAPAPAPGPGPAHAAAGVLFFNQPVTKTSEAEPSTSEMRRRLLLNLRPQGDRRSMGAAGGKRLMDTRRRHTLGVLGPDEKSMLSPELAGFEPCQVSPMQTPSNSVSASTPPACVAKEVDVNTNLDIFASSVDKTPTKAALSSSSSSSSSPAVDDNTEMLRDFVNRHEASKTTNETAVAVAVAVAVAAPKSPVPVCSSGSPTKRVPLAAKDVNSPSPTKITTTSKGKRKADLADCPAGGPRDGSPEPRPRRRRRRLGTELTAAAAAAPAPLTTVHQAAAASGQQPPAPRRSLRNLRPVAASANAAALSQIPVRLDQPFGGFPAAARQSRSEEKDVAAATKVNTRKNRGAAVPPRWHDAVVVANAAAKVPQASQQNEPNKTEETFEEGREGEGDEVAVVVVEGVRAGGRPGRGKTVRWADRLVHYQGQDDVMEDAPEAAVDVAVPGAPVEEVAVAAVKTKEQAKAGFGKAAVPAARRTTRASKLPTAGAAANTGVGAKKAPVAAAAAVAVARRGKIVAALGMSANGTPAPKRTR